MFVLSSIVNYKHDIVNEVQDYRVRHVQKKESVLFGDKTDQK